MLQLNGLKTKVFSQLLQASGILFLASSFANICNLLFWLYMVRRLSPVEYGILNTLFSMFMILSLPSGTIQTVITKFVAEFYGQRDFARIKYFTIHLGIRVILAGILFLACFVIFSPAIAAFLKISSHWLIIVTGIILFVSLLSVVSQGILQGAQRFLAMSINGILSSALKLILGIALVVAGFRVMGALIGFGLAVLTALVISFFQIPRQIRRTSKECSVPLKIESIYQFCLPVFLSLFGWMVLTNGDVILVKHFFSPLDAGFYSIAQMVGKIILFLPGVISVVLFPKMSETFSRQKSSLALLKKGLLITGLLCVIASIFCISYPDLVLKILTHRQDIEAVKLVAPFCIAMTFYALVSQFVFYNLAIHRFGFTVYLLLVSLLQIFLISLFHPNLSTVVLFLILCSSSLFFMGFFEAYREKEA